MTEAQLELVTETLADVRQDLSFVQRSSRFRAEHVGVTAAASKLDRLMSRLEPHSIKE